MCISEFEQAFNLHQWNKREKIGSYASVVPWAGWRLSVTLYQMKLITLKYHRKSLFKMCNLMGIKVDPVQEVLSLKILYILIFISRLKCEFIT